MSYNVELLRYLVRGGTAANLAAVNEIPLVRELVIERDTLRMKLGDGVTSYNALQYFDRTLLLNGDAGAVGQVPISAGPGEPTVWGPPGAAVRASITIGDGDSTLATGRTALLLAIECTEPARIRLYGTAAARSADAARSAGTAPPQGAGLLLEFIATAELLGAPLTPAIIAANLDDPTAGVIYTSVESVSAPADVTFIYLPQEA